jgi:hypothetical protein
VKKPSDGFARDHDLAELALLRVKGNKHLLDDLLLGSDDESHSVPFS